jgi:DNA polymerase I
MSKKLATIFTDVPLDIKEGGIKRGVPNYAALEKIYRELEMNQFLRMMINEEEARRGEVPPLSRSDILSPEPKGSVPPPVPSEGVPSVPSASTPPPAPSEDVNMGTEQKGVQQSFSTAPKAEDKGSISTSVPSEDVSPPARSDEISLANNPPLAPAASAPAPTLPDGNGVIGHNIKAMMVSGEIPFDAKIDFDTELAMYLLNPAASDYVPPIDGVTKEFCEGLRKELEEENLLDVFERVELPLIPILAKFETYGIKTDREILASESSKLKKKIDSLAEEICADAGEAFNVNSPKQLAEILYGKLGLPVLKKTKTGPSTKADVLEKLAEKNPIVKKILEHRQLAKLYGTYAEGLIKQIGADGRIYAKWEQTRTATGRLSSKDPNMQNLPIREERGREIRKAFLPGDGKIFVSADYSQIELRVLAHMSGDENLLEDFRTGADIHVRTAARILGIGESDVTQQLRSRAKAVNFGIIYGMSAFGLSEGVGITPAEAESFIKDYFDIYQGVRTFMDSQVLQAKTTGVVRTILGRKRNVPEIYSKNYMLRKLGERLAQNSPIQGSAADIIKLAMIAVRARLKKESLDERALEILQLHDEIVIETDADIKEEVKAILKEEMESAIELKVPLIVSLAEGRSLYELK